MSRSPPAENARPAPVITATLVTGSAETSAQTRASSPCICSSAALYLSGRSMVMSSTPWSRRSNRSCSYSENFTDCSLGSAHREAAADADGLAGDEGCLIRGEERDDVSHVDRLAESPERDRPGEGFPQLRPRERGEQRGVGRTWTDAVDPDLMACHLPGQRLGEGDDPALGRGVNGLAGRAHPAGVRAEVYHRSAAPFGHERQHRLAGVQHAVQVDGDRAVPVFRVGVDERAGLVPAGVVDQDIDAPELLDDPADHRLDALAIGDVGADRDGARQRVRRFFGAGLVQVGDDDGRPLRGQLAGDGLADTLTIVRAADRAGIHSLWSIDYYNRSSLTRAAAFAAVSETAIVGTSVTPLFARAPLALAAAAADVQGIAGGRYVLEVGSSTRRMNQDWYGTALRHPAPQVRERIELIRRLTAHRSGPFRYEGQFDQVSMAHYDRTALPDSLTILAAGVGEHMVRVAGECADGFVGHTIASAGYLRDTARPLLAEGAARAGRDVAGLRMTTQIVSAASSDPRAARRDAAAQVGFYST